MSALSARDCAVFAEAVANFEGAFSNIEDGDKAAYFTRYDRKFDYAECMSPWCDTPQEAVKSWRYYVAAFEGKENLYWRVRPEIDQNRDEKTIDGAVNPNFNKWAVYSRLRSVSDAEFR